VTERLVFSVREASRLSGYPRDGLYEAIHDGRLAVLHRGRRILVPRIALEQFVDAETRSSNEGVIVSTEPSSKRPRLR
jgi:excisionase family DNA binding protein